MKEFKGSKGEWAQSELFEQPIKVVDEANGAGWLSNTINLIDEHDRIICEVGYRTDFKTMGFGKNETIEKYKANAQLIASAPDLLKALHGIISCCDGNNPDHEQIYYIARDAIKKAIG